MGIFGYVLGLDCESTDGFAVLINLYLRDHFLVAFTASFLKAVWIYKILPDLY